MEAVRDALGTEGRIRVDANGGWSVEEAVAAIRALDRAAGGLEYVEQPCATVEELAAVRRSVDVPVAADESIRRADGPLPGAGPGGRRHRGAQGAAAGRGPRLPADRRGHRPAGRRVVRPGDVGRASPPGSRWPRRCRSSPTPAGWRRSSCSPTTWPSPRCSPSGVGCRWAGRRSTSTRWTGWPPHRSGPRTGSGGWPRSGRCGRIDARDQPLDGPGPCGRRRAGRAGRHRDRGRARVPQRAAAVRGVRRRRGRPGAAAHAASTSAPPGSSPSAWPRRRTSGSRSSAPRGPRSPTCTRRCSRRRTRASPSSPSPPTGRPGCGAPAPTRPPTRSASSARWSPSTTSPASRGDCRAPPRVARPAGPRCPTCWRCPAPATSTSRSTTR